MDQADIWTFFQFKSRLAVSNTHILKFIAYGTGWNFLFKELVWTWWFFGEKGKSEQKINIKRSAPLSRIACVCENFCFMYGTCLGQWPEKAFYSSVRVEMWTRKEKFLSSFRFLVAFFNVKGFELKKNKTQWQRWGFEDGFVLKFLCLSEV